MDYIELIVTIKPRTPWAEILVAQLAEEGFDSFVDTEEGIIAYGPSIQIDPAFMENLDKFRTPEAEHTFELIKVPHQNWNELWEADFDPVYVEDKLLAFL